jgi:hypothetical protein
MLAVLAACPGPLPGAPVDAGLPDAGDFDAGVSDAGSTDAGSTDAGSADAGLPDAGSNPCATDAGAYWDFCDGATLVSCSGGRVFTRLDCTTPNAFPRPWQYVACGLSDTGNDGLIDTCVVAPGATCNATPDMSAEVGLCPGPHNGCEVFPDGGSRCVADVPVENTGRDAYCVSNVSYTTGGLSDHDTRQFLVLSCARYGATCTPPSGGCLIPSGGHCELTWQVACAHGSCSASSHTCP